MVDREKVIKETEDGIAFAESRGFGGLANTMRDVIALLKEQERQLNEYHKADTFLAVHGFWSDNPPYGVKTSVELERP